MASFPMTVNDPNPGFKVPVKANISKPCFFPIRPTVHLIGLQCVVPLTRGPSVIAKPLVWNKDYTQPVCVQVELVPLPLS